MIEVDKFFKGVAGVDENQVGVWSEAVQGTLATVVQNGKGENVSQTGFAIVGTNCYGEPVAERGKADLGRYHIEKMPWERRTVAKPKAALDAQRRARG